MRPYKSPGELRGYPKAGENKRRQCVKRKQHDRNQNTRESSSCLENCHLHNSPNVGDYVLVQYESVNKKNIFHVGETLRKDNDDYEMKFLRSTKMTNKFMKPNIEDKALVHVSQIKQILPKAVSCGQTKRQQGHISFKIDLSQSNVN